MSMQRVLLAFALLICASGATRVYAQTVLIDPGLGTPLAVVQTDPGQSDNVTIPILGGALVNISNAGTRTVLSDFGNPAQGTVGSGNLTGIAWTPSGLLGLGKTLLVTDAEAGTGAGALFEVDPVSGSRHVLSDFGSATQGPLGRTPVAVAYGAGLLGLDDAIYVLDNNAGTNGQGALFEVDPLTGNRILLSDFGNGSQGVAGENPVSLATVPAGVLSSILGNNAGFVVLDDDTGTNGTGAVFVVDRTGHRTLLSDLGNNGQGLPGRQPRDIATAPVGLLGLGTAIYVTDNDIGTNNDGGVYRIQANGNRLLVSDLGSAAQGPTGFDPQGIAATADGSGHLLVADDMEDQLVGPAQLFLIDPVTGNRTSVNNCGNVSLAPCQLPDAVTQY